MLVSFSVANFRSFGEEVTLNMVASNKLEDHKDHRVPIGETGKHVLRSAVIYGANAAGKSNLVKAIGLGQRLICEPSERRAPIAPFRFRPSGDLDPTSFEFRILIEGRVFVYGFDIFRNKFLAEWLDVVDGDHEVPLFDRDEAGKIVVSDSARRLLPSDDRTLDVLEALKALPARNDQLLLNRALTIPDDIQGKTLHSILTWFTEDLVVFPARTRHTDLFDRLQEDEHFRHFCSAFLSSVGTGVDELNLWCNERQASEREKTYLSRVSSIRGFNPFAEADLDVIPKADSPGFVIERKLLSEHRIAPNTYKLPFSEESDGTQLLLQLMPILAHRPDRRCVAVIDELDRSLHPLLCWQFVRFFSESCPGSQRQLVVTTHEAHLLNQELLRRDEYWFVEKDQSQQSRLVSLDEFSIRNDLKVDKGYLNGRFGAIPLIGGMDNLMRLLECPNLETGDAEKESATQP